MVAVNGDCKLIDFTTLLGPVGAYCLSLRTAAPMQSELPVLIQ